jgi:TetR/AcrR family transcriptional regulator, transcriptional repressor for nem operon
MRYPVEQKAETYQRILTAAGRSFRKHGSESNGIARLMKELGLTHGGFYRHFKSKDDLYVEALSRAFEEIGNQMEAVAEAAPKGHELCAIIEHYLSVDHLNDAGTGCVIAALAPEIARQPVEVRKRINQAMQRYRERMLQYFPGRSVEEKRAQFFVLIPGMAGVLGIARAIVDPRRQEEILEAARSFYLRVFARNSRV